MTLSLERKKEIVDEFQTPTMKDSRKLSIAFLRDKLKRHKKPVVLTADHLHEEMEAAAKKVDGREIQGITN